MGETTQETRRKFIKYVAAGAVVVAAAAAGGYAYISSLSGTGSSSSTSTSARKIGIAHATYFLGSDPIFVTPIKSILENLPNKFPQMVDSSKITVVDSVKFSDLESEVKSLADARYDMIFGAGNEWNPGILDLYGSYPKQYFSTVFGRISRPPNFCGYNFLYHHGGFLAGAAAGLVTKTNVIGGISLFSTNPDIVRIQEAYKAGARYVNPNVKSFEVYLEDPANPTKAKETAQTMFAGNADVIYTAPSGGVNDAAIFSAAQQAGSVGAGPLCIGENRLQYQQATDVVLGATDINYEYMIDDMVVRVYNAVNNINPAEGFQPLVYYPGLGSDKIASGEMEVGVSFDFSPSFQSKVSSDIVNKLNTIKQGILDATIIVPDIPTSTGPLT